MTLVSIRNLSVKYGNYTALENVDLDIFDHDFIGIIGPNGGGKTSLVKAIMGTISYTGNISYGDEINRVSGHAIGYLPQQNEFDHSFPISVREVILSGLQSGKRFLRRYTSKDRQRAESLMEMTGIQSIGDHPIGEISGGQMQRALLCRALISGPKLLILDEPANFVDNQFEKELYDILRKLNEQIAIVMVSHDIGTITSIVKTIVCVNRRVHRHDSNEITEEQLQNYNCPIQLICHGEVPHTVLKKHDEK